MHRSRQACWPKLFQVHLNDMCLSVHDPVSKSKLVLISPKFSFLIDEITAFWSFCLFSLTQCQDCILTTGWYRSYWFTIGRFLFWSLRWSLCLGQQDRVVLVHLAVDVMYYSFGYQTLASFTYCSSISWSTNIDVIKSSILNALVCPWCSVLSQEGRKEEALKLLKRAAKYEPMVEKVFIPQLEKELELQQKTWAKMLLCWKL